MNIRVAAAMLSLLMLALSADAVIINILYVDVQKGSDANPGSKNAPLKTITKALSMATPSSMVIVAPGNYAPSTGEVFPLVVPDTVDLVGSHGARLTFLNAKGTGKPVLDLNAVGAGTRIAGFTIGGTLRTGSTPLLPYHGGAVLCRGGASAILERNRFIDNTVIGAAGTSASPNGGDALAGAIFVDAASSCTIRSNTFHGSAAVGGQGKDGLGGDGGNAKAGAILALGPATIVHNTIVSSSAIGGKGGTHSSAAGGKGGNGLAGAIYAPNGGAVVANNIVQNNSAKGGAGGDGAIDGAAGIGSEGGISVSGGTVTHNDLFGNKPAESVSYPNSLAVEVVFSNEATYQLAMGSPAIAAGTAAFAATHDFDNAPRPDPPAIGAQEPKVRYDVDGDAKADLIWHNVNTGENSVWLMNGTGVPKVTILPSLDPAYNAVAAADFNGDRRTDILFRHKTSAETFMWLFMNAVPGSLGTIAKGTMVSAPDAMWKVVSTGDYNNDGNDDILWRHSNGLFKVALMEGVGMLSEHSLGLELDAQWRVVASADFDGNGFDDLLWRHSTSNGVRVWHLSPTYGYTTSLPMQDSMQWQFAGIGDFAGDQSFDILWRELATGEHLLWPIAGDMIAPSEFLQSWGDSLWRIERVANFDGDRYDDIAWRNTSTQKVAIHLMSGSTVTSSATFGTSLTNDWKPVP